MKSSGLSIPSMTQQYRRAETAAISPDGRRVVFRALDIKLGTSSLWVRDPLLTREPADSRDPQTALHLALDVAKKTGYKDPNYLDTLSLAYHLAGETAEAIENQKRAIALLPEGESALRRALEEALARFEAEN